MNEQSNNLISVENHMMFHMVSYPVKNNLHKTTEYFTSVGALVF